MLQILLKCIYNTFLSWVMLIKEHIQCYLDLFMSVNKNSEIYFKLNHDRIRYYRNFELRRPFILNSFSHIERDPDTWVATSYFPSFCAQCFNMFWINWGDIHRYFRIDSTKESKIGWYFNRWYTVWQWLMIHRLFSFIPFVYFYEILNIEYASKEAIFWRAVDFLNFRF